MATRNIKVQRSMALPQSDQFKSLLTEDGSPTMSLFPTWEPMHALDGAFTETIYIYQPTAEKAFQHVPTPRLLSMGLGLGYNEILTAFEALKQKREACEIYSYEKMTFLIENFSAWVDGKDCDLQGTYDLILKYFSEKYQIPGPEAKTFLKKLQDQNLLHLREAFTSETEIPACHGVYFDAFSGKTSPELWDEILLKRFFRDMATPCFISTYACKGALKRSLMENGFALDIQKGFGKKRESTFAYRLN